MKVKDILALIDDSNSEYELVMSCHNSEYSRDNPSKVKNVGWLYEDCGDLNFEIDWNHKAKTYANELYSYDEDMNIISWDCDDGYIIKFKDIYVWDEGKCVILI